MGGSAEGKVVLVTGAASGMGRAGARIFAREGATHVYVADINGLPGFENNLVAALQKKRVNLIVVADRANADFEITGFADNQSAGWAKIIFSNGRPESEASIQMVNLRTGVIAYAVASYKVSSYNGNKSTAEHLAKNLRQKMERDEKRLRGK